MLTWITRRFVFYTDSSGSSPIEEFLDGLNAKDARKVTWVLKLIEEVDTVPAIYFKKLAGTDDIWEVRVQSSGNAYRLLCFLRGGNIVVLTNGFSKKSQKTPSREIRLAEKRKDMWIKRNK
jgi:phage-related protein